VARRPGYEILMVLPDIVWVEMIASGEPNPGGTIVGRSDRRTALVQVDIRRLSPDP
jgi:hypothetical protein